MKPICIFLSGNSKNSNETWSKEIIKKLIETKLFKEVKTIRYSHWDQNPTKTNESKEPTTPPRINRSTELKKLKPLLERIKEDQTYIVVAKSAGVGLIVETLNTNKNIKKPFLCIFSGIPIHKDKHSNHGLTKHLPNFNIKSIMIQNPNERLIHPKELEEHLKDINVTNTTVILGKGNSHSYTVEEMVDTTIKEFNNYLKEK